MRRAEVDSGRRQRWVRRLPALPPFVLVVVLDAETLGGAERCLGTLLAGLDDDFSVVLCGPDREVLEAIAPQRPGVRRLLVHPPTRLRHLRRAWALRRQLVRLAPDLVHANLTSSSSCEGMLAVALTLGVPVVAVEHLPLPPRSRWSALLKLMTSRAVTAHVAVGETAARLVEHHCRLRRGSVGVIRNGVCDPGQRPARRPHAAPVVLGTLGRLVPQKGLDVLLHALVDVPGARLHVTGDGPERTRLGQLARELGVDGRTSFLGATSDPAGRLADYDVLVQPSREEGLPLVVLEAMFVGRPVVATDVGSTAEAVLEGETGFLVPAEDPSALASGLQPLVVDAALRGRLGAAGRDRARAHFDAARMTAEYERLYRTVLDRKPPVARRTLTTGWSGRVSPARGAGGS